MFKSLKTTLLFSHLGIIILTNLVVGGILYSFMVSSLENKQRQYLDFTTEHAAAMIRSELLHKSDLLGRIANGPEVLQFSENYRDLALTAYFAKFQHEFSSIAFVNRSGLEELQVQGTELSDAPPLDHSTSSFFKQALSHPDSIVFSSSQGTAYDGQAVLLMAIAKFNYFEDTFAGLVLVALPYEKIAQSISTISLNASTTYLLDDNHTFSILVSSSTDESSKIVIRKINETPHAHAKDPKASEIFYDKREVFGSQALTTHYHLPEINWTITSVLPYTILVQEIHRIRNSVMSIFGAMLVMSAFAAYFLAYRITSPIFKLTQAAKAVSRGNMDQIVSIQSQDEVGRMAQTFNYMIKSLKQSEAKLQEIAITDELTSLLNRRGFMGMAMQQLQVAKRREGNTFLLFADLDNLKLINDTLGHQGGDQVIQEAGRVLRDSFRDSDIIGRLGGDEFAVLFADAEDEKSIVERLEKNIFSINAKVNRTYQLSLSMGMVPCDFTAGCTLESLMKEADSLMYQCKQKKKGGDFYHPVLRQ